MSTNGRTQIVILGGGFGGVYTAMHLEKQLAHEPNVDITLVNRENFFLFTPMLHEVAASDLDITHIVNPIRKLLHRTNFFEGNVEYIDLPHKCVGVSHSYEPHQHELPYDYLVLALGSITNFFNLPGLEDHALTVKSLGDAIQVRDRMIANLEEASSECAVRGRASLLSVVVAGGGFAGVETIAGINDFLRESIACYPNLSAELLRLVLVHPGEVILPELGPKLGAYAQKKLPRRGVDIRTNTRVTGVTEHGVTLNDGSTIPSCTVMWTAGTTPNPLLVALPCAKERGRVVVNEYMEVSEWPGVWALGDCALVPDCKTGTYYPPTAQHALREGKVLAHNITATLRSGQKKPFVFKTLGQLAAIGKRMGVANILGMNFSGFIAWWLWRTIYLSKLPRLEKKLRVMMDWTLDLVFSKDLVQFLTLRAPTVSHVEHGEHVSHM
jgi:NADH:ubiquinone reductase (H+-translocating)